jgi:hypothetical protein
MSEIVDRGVAALIAAMPDELIAAMDDRKDAYTMVRAVIAAMREPTEAMLMAAREYSGAATSNAEQDCEPYREAWQEMIDAALKEPRS